MWKGHHGAKIEDGRHSIYSGMYFDSNETRSLITHDSHGDLCHLPFDFYGSKLFSQGAPEKCK
jgi:hypothetical protein